MSKRQLIAAIAGFAGLCAGIAEGRADCSVPGFEGKLNAVTTTQMSVGTGEGCVIRHHTFTGKNGDNRRYPTSSIHLLSSPAHGSASVDGSRVVYRSERGFRGTDSFLYRTNVQGTRKDGPYDYRVTVEVY